MIEVQIVKGEYTTCTASITITVNSIKKLSVKGHSKKLAAGKTVIITAKSTDGSNKKTMVKIRIK